MTSLPSDLFPVQILEDDDEQALHSEFHAAAMARIDETLSNHPWLLPETLEERARKIHRENAGLTVKRTKFYRLADSFNNAIAGNVACRTGCTHCCSMITF